MRYLRNSCKYSISRREWTDEEKSCCFHYFIPTSTIIALTVIEFRWIEKYDYLLTLNSFCNIYRCRLGRGIKKAAKFVYSPRRVCFEWLCINIPNRWHASGQWRWNWIVIIHYRITFLVFHWFHRHRGSMSGMSFSIIFQISSFSITFFSWKKLNQELSWRPRSSLIILVHVVGELIFDDHTNALY